MLRKHAELLSKTLDVFVRGRDRSIGIQQLQAILDSFKPLDVGLSEPLNNSGSSEDVVSNNSEPISYLHMYDCDRFTMGIFCIPGGSTIPLHDHPEMTVLSKLLYGKLHVRSFDWLASAPHGNNRYTQGDESKAPLRVSPSFSLPKGSRPAMQVADKVMYPSSPTAVLFPDNGGVVHEFMALTDCAILDVLSPPYNVAEGRDCTYYKELTVEGGHVLVDTDRQTDRRTDGVSFSSE